MRLLFATAAVAAVASAADPLPLSNGFPTPSNKAIETIERHAGGALPNAPLPTKITPTARVIFSLLAAQETFEAAYFTELLKNVTNEAPGFKVPNKKYIMRSLRRIRAQEELHALGINTILENSGFKALPACEYKFPVTNFDSAIQLANLFTDVVLATLPAAQMQFAADGGDEVGLIPLVGSITAQEGEQVGVFRQLQGKVPSAAPFLTGGPAEFAYTALKMFLVPGSCPEVTKQIKLDTYPALTVVKDPGNANGMAKFSVEGSVSDSMAIAYLSGQNLPLTEKISNIQKKNGVTTFEAKFPFVSGGFAKGLTYAAVVKKNKDFASAEDVAAATAFGPGLIEIM